jgi:hypothetical protein
MATLSAELGSANIDVPLAVEKPRRIADTTYNSIDTRSAEYTRAIANALIEELEKAQDNGVVNRKSCDMIRKLRDSANLLIAVEPTTTADNSCAHQWELKGRSQWCAICAVCQSINFSVDFVSQLKVMRNQRAS